MLRKASQALFANEQFNLEEMHNYRMAVTEREVINGCLNVENVSYLFLFQSSSSFLSDFYPLFCVSLLSLSLL
jgi:hypothetical protein